MALTSCRECGAPTRSDAAVCEHCGARDPASGCLGLIAASAGALILILLVLEPTLFSGLKILGLEVPTLVGLLLTLIGLGLAIARRFVWLVLPAGLLAICALGLRLGTSRHGTTALFAIAASVLLVAAIYGVATSRRGRRSGGQGGAAEDPARAAQERPPPREGR